MKKLILTLACFALFHPAQAEMIEGNVTLQLKLTRQVLVKQTETSLTTKFAVSSYKNADFIQHMSAVKGGTPFSKSAKIIYQFGNEGTGFYIRDKSMTNDYDISDYFSLDSQSQGQVASQKITFDAANPGTTKVGTEKYLALARFLVATTTPQTENLSITGSMIYSTRSIRSKLMPEFTLPLPTMSVTGSGVFGFPNAVQGVPDQGIVQGSIKISGAKVVPSPVLPPET